MSIIPAGMSRVRPLSESPDITEFSVSYTVSLDPTGNTPTVTLTMDLERLSLILDALSYIAPMAETWDNQPEAGEFPSWGFRVCPTLFEAYEALSDAETAIIDRLAEDSGTFGPPAAVQRYARLRRANRFGMLARHEDQSKILYALAAGGRVPIPKTA